MKEIKKGNWTQFETQTWEQYYINYYADGGFLDNTIYAITEKKFLDCLANHENDHPRYCKQLKGTKWPDHV